MSLSHLYNRMIIIVCITHCNVHIQWLLSSAFLAFVKCAEYDPLLILIVYLFNQFRFSSCECVSKSSLLLSISISAPLDFPWMCPSGVPLPLWCWWLWAELVSMRFCYLDRNQRFSLSHTLFLSFSFSTLSQHCWSQPYIYSPVPIPIPPPPDSDLSVVDLLFTDNDFQFTIFFRNGFLTII